MDKGGGAVLNLYLRREEACGKCGSGNEIMNLFCIEGLWTLIKPIQAEMELVRSGYKVRGTYCNSELKGIIEGTITEEGEDCFLTGKWGDQLGSGDFIIAFRASSTSKGPSECVFYGKWRHSGNQDWNGVFEGKRDERMSHV
jgi:hypothetical protein